uniref:Biogenesis of lysosome-related organelles complex 1 subunit 5 n=1 Tax=Timema cristinae TaxID=61476 RepID=A0A7R9CQ78_TIMCR|nr:unnamed protein product [Timema cristinae]
MAVTSSTTTPIPGLAPIIKDTGEIWTRLFDHRPFLNGEIKFFLKEFEEKRSDREVERIFQIFEKVTEIKDTQVDRVQLSADAHLATLSANLEVAVSMCDRILEKEQGQQMNPALLDKRESRKLEWQHFIEDMTSKCAKVDTTFEERDTQLPQNRSPKTCLFVVGSRRPEVAASPLQRLLPALLGEVSTAWVCQEKHKSKMDAVGMRYLRNVCVKTRMDRHDITGRSLIRFNESTLVRLGVDNAEHRQEIWREIMKLRLKTDIIEIRDLERRNNYD